MRKEYDVALGTWHFRIVLFSYDDWYNHGILKLSENQQTEIN